MFNNFLDFFWVCVDEGMKMVMKMMKRMREEDEES